MSAFPLEHEIEYPTSDGQPMAESTLHRKVMSDLIESLERRYADVPDVWAGGNLFLCYEKGNPAAIVAPDVLLAKGVAKWDRPNYLLWEEKPPSLVVEVTSRSTRREDVVKKKALYERIGVEEYVLFDPYGEYLRPRLQGYRLSGHYQPIALEKDGTLRSRTIGLTFRPEGERLRLVDTATAEPLLWSDELEPALRAAEKARKADKERIRTLEAELSRLREQQSSAKPTKKA